MPAQIGDKLKKPQMLGEWETERKTKNLFRGERKEEERGSRAPVMCPAKPASVCYWQYDVTSSDSRVRTVQSAKISVSQLRFSGKTLETGCPKIWVSEGKNQRFPCPNFEGLRKSGTLSGVVTENMKRIQGFRSQVSTVLNVTKLGHKEDRRMTCD
jgi:hypothetical protein